MEATNYPVGLILDIHNILYGAHQMVDSKPLYVLCLSRYYILLEPIISHSEIDLPFISEKPKREYQYFLIMLFFESKDCTIIFSSLKVSGGFPVQDALKAPEEISSPVFTGIMAVITGIVAMIRLTRNMPKKLTDANLYSSPVYCSDTMIKGQADHHQLLGPSISRTEYLTVMKRMAELEERVNVPNMKPTVMPAEKEEMLNITVSRVDALEQELMATKKVSSEVPMNYVTIPNPHNLTI